MHTTHLAWSFVALGAPERFEPLMNSIDHHLLPADTDLAFGVFAHDWRAVGVDAWFDVMESWDLFGLDPHQRPKQLTVLSRPDFDLAIRDALRTQRDRRQLAATP